MSANDYMKAQKLGEKKYLAALAKKMNIHICQCWMI